jgi:lipopolysaccharide export system protein LptA
LCTGFSLAQKNILTLLPGSDELTYDERTGKQRLRGNVHFTYEGNVMFCDSAHYKARTQEVWAFGKVQINKQDTLNLFCDSLYYNGRTRLAKLKGHVRVRDREYKVVTDTLEYDARAAKAIYRYGGRIENITTNEVLTSRLGYFYPNTEESFFRGNVVYKSPDLKMTTDTLHYNYLQHRVYFKGPTDITTKDTKLYCETGWYNVQTEEGVLRRNARIDQAPRIITGDSLYYAPKKKLAIGQGNVIVHDTAQKTRFSGGYFLSDGLKREDILTKSPLVELMKSKDTLYLTADTLFHYRDTTDDTQSVIGRQNVKIFQNKVQGTADTLIYNRAEGVMDMWGKPRFWSRNSELSGDSIRVYVRNDSLVERVHLRNNAFSAMEIDSGRYYNQLAGNEIWAYLRDNEIYLSVAKANARTVYFTEETKNTDTATVITRSGMNRLFAADLKVYLDSGEVTGITFFKEPDGLYFPIDQIDPEEQYLKGFQWNPALRPKSWQELVSGRQPVRRETLE